MSGYRIQWHHGSCRRDPRSATRRGRGSRAPCEGHEPCRSRAQPRCSSRRGPQLALADARRTQPGQSRTRSHGDERSSPFQSWAEVEAVTAELDPRFAAIPIFAAGTGLRPEEWIALERRDVNRQENVVHVRRVYSQGQLKQCAKTSRQRRRVPLRQRALDALVTTLHPASSTRPCSSRRREAVASRERSGAAITGHPQSGRPESSTAASTTSDTRSPASRSPRESSLFYLARIMGTSVAQIDATYGHLLPIPRTICAVCSTTTTRGTRPPTRPLTGPYLKGRLHPGPSSSRRRPQPRRGPGCSSQPFTTCAAASPSATRRCRRPGCSRKQCKRAVPLEPLAELHARCRRFRSDPER